MSHTELVTVFWAVSILLVGYLIGRVIEASRWRANAEDNHRLESRGRLYKVTRA